MSAPEKKVKPYRVYCSLLVYTVVCLAVAAQKNSSISMPIGCDDTTANAVVSQCSNTAVGFAGHQLVVADCGNTHL